MHEAGAPFRHADYFGVDILVEENLLASRCSMEEIRERLGVYSIGCLSVESGAKLAECSWASARPVLTGVLLSASAQAG